MPRRVVRRGLMAGLIALLTLGSIAPRAAVAVSGTEEPVPLVLFWGAGCPHCAEERAFLEVLQAERPDLVIEQYEVRYDERNRALFEAYAAAHDIEIRGVPTTFLDDLVWVGFDETVAREITSAVDALLEGEPVEPGEDIVVLPIVGEIEVGSLSLGVATLVIGFVDGFNPCSLWVLSILLALVLHSGSRRRLLAVGTTFLAVTTAMYAAYIVALYGALSFVAHLDWIRVAMAAIALAFGVINIKDYFRFKQGPSLTISERHKPGLYKKMRAVAVSERPLPAVLAGTAALAVGVSLIETPCTAGLPLLWVDLLNTHSVGTAASVGLFALYMSVFLLDEIVILVIAAVAMRVTRLDERGGRVLKLVSGSVMLVLALVLVFVPDAMTSVTGALVVLGGAGLLSGLTVALTKARQRGKRRPGGRPRPRSMANR